MRISDFLSSLAQAVTGGSAQLSMILNMSITGSVVILFVLLARLALKKAPKIFSYALWSVVLFRLLCPISITTNFSLLSLLDAPVTVTNEHTTIVEYVPQEPVTPAMPETQQPAVGNTGTTAVVIPQQGGQTVTPQNPPSTSEIPQKASFPVMAVLWLSGVGVMAAYSVISYLRLRRKLVGAVLLRDNINLADGISTPFVMGFVRPRIYLPSALSEQEQGYIILHEQHHIRRGDHIIKALAFVALCIHWFNPLVWVAFMVSSKDMEMSCDEAVVKKLGEDIRADYSASLLSLATGRRIIAGTPLAFGEGDTKGRIKNMLNWKQAKPAVVFLAAAAVILAVVFCGTNQSNYAQVSGEDTAAYLHRLRGAYRLDSGRIERMVEALDLEELGEYEFYGIYRSEGGLFPRKRYELTVDFSIEPENEAAFNEEMEHRACILLGLIGNLEHVTYSYLRGDQTLTASYFYSALDRASGLGDATIGELCKTEDGLRSLLAFWEPANLETPDDLPDAEVKIPSANPTEIALEPALHNAIIDYFRQGDNADYRVETHKILHSVESQNTTTVYGLVCYQGYDAEGNQVQECPHPMEAVLELRGNQYVVVSFNDWFDLQSKLPTNITQEVLNQTEAELQAQCKQIAAEHFGLPGTPAAPVVENVPFSNQPIEWSSPLNGMFERTYETQLRMMKNIDQAYPFFEDETLEFDSCAVLLGERMDREDYSRSGAAYIIFRDGALGKLPLPMDANGRAACPETVQHPASNALTYSVEAAGGTCYYVVDLERRTVSMSIGARGPLPELPEQRLPSAPPAESDIHNALMSNYTVYTVFHDESNAYHPYRAEAHHVWAVQQDGKTANVYALVNFTTYDWENGRQKRIAWWDTPAKITFEWNDSWQVTDFWCWDESEQYETAIQSRFPADIAALALASTDADITALNIRSHETATAYYAAQSGLPAYQPFTPADVEFSGRVLYTSADTMTYAQRLAWAQAGEDNGNVWPACTGQYIEGEDCIAYVDKIVGGRYPDLGLGLRFADGTVSASLPLPRANGYDTALPETIEFRDGKFIYEITFPTEEVTNEGMTLIHLKGTYHYEVDLTTKTVSLSVLQ